MFNFLKPTNINEKVAQYEQTQGAVLLDVRTREEYNGGYNRRLLQYPCG